MTRQRAAILTAIIFIAGVAALVMLRPGAGTQAAPDPISAMTPLLQRPDAPPTPTLGPAPDAGLQVAPGSTVLLRDAFDSAESNATWTAVDLVPLRGPDEPARWGVMDGMLRQLWTGDIQMLRVGPTIAVAGSPDWRDYTFTINAYAEENMVMGVVFRRQGNSFYRFNILNNAYDDAQKIVLEKVIDGRATTLATLAGPGYETHRWYTLKVSAIGSQITAQLDDLPPLTAEDSSLAQGQVGVYGYAMGRLGFDNALVVAP